MSDNTQPSKMLPSGCRSLRMIAFLLILCSFIIPQFAMDQVSLNIADFFYGGSLHDLYDTGGHVLIYPGVSIIAILGLLILRSLFNGQNVMAANYLILAQIASIAGNVVFWICFPEPPIVGRIIADTFFLVANSLSIYAAIHLIRNGIEYSYFWFILLTISTIIWNRYIDFGIYNALGLDPIVFSTEDLFTWLNALLGFLTYWSFYKLLKDDDLYTRDQEMAKGDVIYNCSLKNYISVPLVLILFIAMTGALCLNMDMLSSFANL